MVFVVLRAKTAFCGLTGPKGFDPKDGRCQAMLASLGDEVVVVVVVAVAVAVVDDDDDDDEGEAHCTRTNSAQHGWRCSSLCPESWTSDLRPWGIWILNKRFKSKAKP